MRHTYKIVFLFTIFINMFIFFLFFNIHEVHADNFQHINIDSLLHESYTQQVVQYYDFYNTETEELERHSIKFDATINMGSQLVVIEEGGSVRIFSENRDIQQNHCSISNVEVPPFVFVNNYTFQRNEVGSSSPDIVSCGIRYSSISPYRGEGSSSASFAHYREVSVGFEAKTSQGDIYKVHLYNSNNGHSIPVEGSLFEKMYSIIIESNIESFSHPLQKRENLETRLVFYWNNDYRYLYPLEVPWVNTDTNGRATFLDGELFELTGKGHSPALYACVGGFTGIGQCYTYPELEGFQGKIIVHVKKVDGQPVHRDRLVFFGGMGNSWITESCSNGRCEIQIVINNAFPEQADKTLSMTVMPRVDFDWNITQVIDNPSRIVDYKAHPVFISPEVSLGSGYFANSFFAMNNIRFQVFDADDPERKILTESLPRMVQEEYLSREKSMGMHRVYLEVDPKVLVKKRLGIRAIAEDSDHGRRSDTRILGEQIDPVAVRHIYKPKREFLVDFIPLRVGEWEDGKISYPNDKVRAQLDYIRSIFPAPVAFRLRPPEFIARGGLMTHNMYIKRIFGHLQRLQKMNNVDLVVGMAPPGFLGAAGLQNAGTFGLNWTLLGAVQGAVLIDPAEVLKHHTIHEYIHTLGFKDVYPSDDVMLDLRKGWRPISANGHQGRTGWQAPINNIYREPHLPGGQYVYHGQISERIMYDHANLPWPDEGEYDALLERWVENTPVSASSSPRTRSNTSTTKLLLISGDVLNPASNQRTVSLDPILVHHGEPDYGNLGPYQVELVAENGTVLERGAFPSCMVMDQTTCFASFSLALPYHDNIAAIEFSDISGTLWKRYEYSGAAPSISWSGPQAGTLSGAFTLSWTIGNTSATTLSSTLLSSTDNGQTWSVIAMDVPHNAPGLQSLALHAQDFLAGDSYRFKVMVSDGIRSRELISPHVYKMNGHVAKPELQMARTDYTITVPPGGTDAYAYFVLENVGNSVLQVQFQPESFPDWASSPLAIGPQYIEPGGKTMAFTHLRLQDVPPGQQPRADLTLTTNDPDSPTATIRIHIVEDEAAFVPNLDHVVTSPVESPEGWLVNQSIDILGIPSGGRSGLQATMRIVSLPSGNVVTTQDMPENQNQLGSYMFNWNPGEDGVAPGRYGARILLSDPETGLERPGSGHDLTFSLRAPTSLSVTIFPQEAANAGAQWRRSGRQAWIPSGHYDHGLAPGNHQVEFAPVPGWQEPGRLAVSLGEKGPHFDNVEYVPNPNVYRIDANVAGAGGSVVGGSNYLHNTLVTLKATPERGYRFLHWKDDLGNIISTDAHVTFRATAGRTLTAHFEEQPGSLPGVLMLLLDGDG